MILYCTLGYFLNNDINIKNADVTNDAITLMFLCSGSKVGEIYCLYFILFNWLISKMYWWIFTIHDPMRMKLNDRGLSIGKLLAFKQPKQSNATQFLALRIPGTFAKLLSRSWNCSFNSFNFLCLGFRQCVWARVFFRESLHKLQQQEKLIMPAGKLELGRQWK